MQLFAIETIFGWALILAEPSNACNFISILMWKMEESKLQLEIGIAEVKRYSKWAKQEMIKTTMRW